jgi:hypothetical protein
MSQKNEAIKAPKKKIRSTPVEGSEAGVLPTWVNLIS